MGSMNRRWHCGWVFSLTTTFLGIIVYCGVAEAGTLTRLFEEAERRVPVPNIRRLFRGETTDGVTLQNAREVSNSDEFPRRVNGGAFSASIEAELVDRFTLTGVYPVTSSSPSLIYDWDQKLQIAVPKESTLAPIFSERYQATGKSQLTFGAVATYYDYDRLDGAGFDDLNNDTQGRGDLNDFRISRFNVTLNYWIVTLVATYGLSPEWDVSILVPLIRVHAEVAREVEIVGSAKIGEVHSFDSTRVVSHVSSPKVKDTDYGVGDIVLRTKRELVEWEDWGVAAGLSLTVPSGDAEKLMGSDSVVLEPALYASGGLGSWVFPHANVGLDFKLADQGKVDEIFRDSNPDQETHGVESPAVLGAHWTAGVSIKVHERLTAIVDFRGVSDIARREQIRLRLDREGTVKTREREHIFDIAIGLRGWIVRERAIGFVNFLLPLNRDEGARSNFTPTFGVEMPI